MSTVHRFKVQIEPVDGFEYVVRFDKPHHAPVHVDEPAPLGRDAAPNAARYLAAAIGNCLAASLLFCLKRSRTTAPQVTAEVEMEIVRTETKRLRVGQVDVVLRTTLAKDDAALAGCLGTFEDFCVVTQSVRKGIDVRVRVESP